MTDDASAPESLRPSAEKPSPSGADLTPAAFCGLLSDTDLRALQQPPVGKQPEPVDKDGSPGCDWSLGGPGRHLEMSVFTAPDPELISQTATSTFPVGSVGTGYVSFGSVVGGCNALVRTQDAPAAQFLRYTLESLDGSVTGCDQGIPQVLTVLRGLKW
ncbi:MAG: hypothetical protein JHC79_21910 [Williamsia sp.]|nr:hypothetical protein [Williamsia sp.]MBJ7291576.1 hypothetical protein [Williamsia sp.]